MIKDEIITVRVTAAVKEALKQAAENDVRTLASMAAKVLTDYVRSQGYLPSPESKGAPRRNRRD